MKEIENSVNEGKPSWWLLFQLQLAVGSWGSILDLDAIGENRTESKIDNGTAAA